MVQRDGRNRNEKPKQNMTDQYKMQIRCENCGHVWSELIPMGCSSAGYFKCTYCGCNDGRSEGKPRVDSIAMMVRDVGLYRL